MVSDGFATELRQRPDQEKDGIGQYVEESQAAAQGERASRG